MISYRRALSNVFAVAAVVALLAAGAILHEATNPLDYVVATILGVVGALLFGTSYRVDDRFP